MKKVLYIVVLSLFTFACSSDDTTAVDQALIDSDLIEAYATANGLNLTQTASGLYYQILDANQNTAILLGDTANVTYTGSFLDEFIFDSNARSGNLLQFRIGAGAVVPGFEEGVSLMKEEERALIILPSRLGYGASGTTGIPGNTVIKFEVILNKIGNS